MILCESIDDDMRLALTLNQIGLIEKKVSNYPSAIAYLDRALQLFSDLNDIELTSNVYNNIGSAYKLKRD
tara:strand:+ start:102 stop:311 length:210 start_codon:yes stop_codon:yes gene_type:complete